MVTGVGLGPHGWLWLLQGSSENHKAGSEGYSRNCSRKLGTRDNKCVMMATRVGCNGNRVG